MVTRKRHKLKALYTCLAAGRPLTSKVLAGLDISADLAVHYVRASWPTRLARGVYCRPGDTLQLHPSLELLVRGICGLHVGGKTALDWHGLRQYVSQQPRLALFGWDAHTLPEWFADRFPATYHRKRLFDERPDAPLHVAPFAGQTSVPAVSEPERALLEVLSEVGVRQSLSEARQLVESSYALRAAVMGELLQHCKSVKTARLCMQLGREAPLPWVEKLDPRKLPPGSDRH